MAKVTMQTNIDRIRSSAETNAFFEARPAHRPKMKLRGKQRKHALAEAGRLRRRRMDDFADYMGSGPDYSDLSAPDEDRSWDSGDHYLKR